MKQQTDIILNDKGWYTIPKHGVTDLLNKDGTPPWCTIASQGGKHPDIISGVLNPSWPPLSAPMT